MANFCEPTDVEGIIDFNPSIASLQPFIDAAHELVVEICQNAPLVGTQTAYSTERLKQIETWLAAHFLAVRDPRYISESVGPASASTGQQMGLNLGLTPYGQQAMLLDTKGGLAWLDKHISQGKRARVGIVYLGTQRQHWLDYPWRFFGVYQ